MTNKKSKNKLDKLWAQIAVSKELEKTRKKVVRDSNILRKAISKWEDDTLEIVGDAREIRDSFPTESPMFRFWNNLQEDLPDLVDTAVKKRLIHGDDQPDLDESELVLYLDGMEKDWKRAQADQTKWEE